MIHSPNSAGKKSETFCYYHRTIHVPARSWLASETYYIELVKNVCSLDSENGTGRECCIGMISSMNKNRSSREGP